MPFESAHLFRRKCFSAFCSSSMVKRTTSRSPVFFLSRTKAARRGDSKTSFRCKSIFQKICTFIRTGHSSSFFVEEKWSGAQARWVGFKRSKSLKSSKTCSTRPVPRRPPRSPCPVRSSLGRAGPLQRAVGPASLPQQHSLMPAKQKNGPTPNSFTIQGATLSS